MSVALFWATTFGFLFGIFSRSLLSLGWFDVGFIILLAVSLLSLAGMRRESSAALIIVSVALFAGGAGMVRMSAASLVSDQHLNAVLGEQVVLEGVVFEEPDVRENSTRLSVQVEALFVRGATTTVTAGVLVVAPLYADIAYGDRIRAEGELRFPKGFDAGAGREFNYPAYLAKDGILYELVFARAEKVGEGKKSILKAAAIRIKQRYLEGLSFALPEPQAGLAGGITAGDKRGLGAELSETFRVAGLIHIVVLSGYNIMVVIGFLERLLRRAPALLRLGLGTGVAVFFALMTGLASSSVRAAGMAVIASVGKTTGRSYLAARALALVAFSMVFWNPWILAFDPGFQLSVIATWGLIFLSPLLAMRLRFITERFGLREIAATTVGTQLAVLPLILYQSGQLSLVALPANLLALMVVPYAMLASFIAGIFGLITGSLAPIIGFPAYALLSYILLVAESAEQMPLATVTVGNFGYGILIVLYVMLFVAYRMANARKNLPDRN